MIIILDGYNILKQFYLPDQVLTAQRTTFINQLKKYAYKKGHEIILVFDGGNSTYSTREVMDKITVVYSGIRQSADDYIIEYCNIHKTKQYLLITSDNALIKKITNQHIVTLDSISFMKFLKTALSSNTPPKAENIITKLTTESSALIDELMMHAAKLPHEKKDVYTDLISKTNNKQLSKQERKLHLILKKL